MHKILQSSVFASLGTIAVHAALAAILLLVDPPGAQAQDARLPGAGSPSAGSPNASSPSAGSPSTGPQSAGSQSAPGHAKAPGSTHQTMEAYGRTYPYCREWTDNCQICLSGDDGRIVCSTVAIACVQKPIECRSLRWPPAAKAKTGKDGAGEK
ncbi:MAG: hypothetical protein KDJ29_10715 [Hyphomicrobiales bacterium]|nr:hypothetical protein [Hyphomicrobiales bacterium]